MSIDSFANKPYCLSSVVRCVCPLTQTSAPFANVTISLR